VRDVDVRGVVLREAVMVRLNDRPTCEDGLSANLAVVSS
jgi:hypothetical protein